MSLHGVAIGLLDGERAPQSGPARESGAITPMAGARHRGAGAALCLITRSDGELGHMVSVFVREGEDWVAVGDGGGPGDWLLERPADGVQVGAVTLLGRDDGCFLAITGTVARNVGELSLSAAGVTVPIEPVATSGCFVALLRLDGEPSGAEVSFRDGSGELRSQTVALGDGR